MKQQSAYKIKQGIAADFPDMSRLSAEILGPGRFVRTAYRLREQLPGDKLIILNAYIEKELVGTVSLTPLKIDGQEGAFMLGPLLVAKAHRGRDLGKKLMAACRDHLLKHIKGAELIILIGDLDYYARAGYQQIPLDQLKFPGPLDKGRILGFELKPGALDKFAGKVGV